MSYRVDCPFCNATTVLGERDAKAVCTRCGEAFAPTHFDDVSEAVSESFDDRRPVVNTSRIAIAVLMLAGAVAGLIAWQLWKSPPAAVVPNTAWLPPPPPPPAVTMPPAKLSGLLHLPPDCNIIAAVQPAALEEYAKRTGTDARTLFSKYGVPQPVLDAIDRTSVPWSQIDHIAVGLTLAPDRLIPGVTVVLALRQPLDSVSFLQRLHAEKKPKAGRAIYTTSVSGLLVSPIDTNTYLFGLLESDFPAAKPNTLAFATPLLKHVQERLSPASFAWLVTDSRNWSDAHPLLKTDDGKKIATRIANARSVTVGLSLEPDPTLNVMFDAADESTAKALEAFLAGKLDAATITRDGPTLKLLAPANAATMNTLSTLIRDHLK